MARKPKWTPPTEKNVQSLCISLFRKAGCKVRSTSQYRASHIAPGIADLIVTHRERRLAFWFEVKRPRGKDYNPAFPHSNEPEDLRPDQDEFMFDCLAAGWNYYWGGVRMAEEALICEGLGHKKGGVFYHGDDPDTGPDSVRGILRDTDKLTSRAMAAPSQLLKHFQPATVEILTESPPCQSIAPRGDPRD